MPGNPEPLAVKFTTDVCDFTPSSAKAGPASNLSCGGDDESADLRQKLDRGQRVLSPPRTGPPSFCRNPNA